MICSFAPDGLESGSGWRQPYDVETVPGCPQLAANVGRALNWLFPVK